MSVEFYLFVSIILSIVMLNKLSALRKRTDEIQSEITSLKKQLRQTFKAGRAEDHPAEHRKEQPTPTIPVAVPPPIPSGPDHNQPLEEVVWPPDAPPPLEPLVPAWSDTHRKTVEVEQPLVHFDFEPPSEPSRIGVILRRIWEWILVGDEFRRPGASVEFAVASTWLLRAGIIVIVACVGWFLKWSLDRDLIGPMGRTGMAVFAGLGMLTAGYRLLGKRYHLMGQGLFGGGLATLYFSMYAAGPLYELLPLWAAFLLMILVTLAAGMLAVRVDSMLIAILGIIGGFCTPIMLRTGEAHFSVLYSYLLLLGVGILFLTHFKTWRLLNYLGFVLTWLLVLGSLFEYQRTDFPVVLTLTSLLFVLHTSIVYWHHVMHRVKSTVLEVVYLIVNAAIFPALAYGLIQHAHGRPWPAVLMLLLTAFYTAHVLVLLRLGRGDRTLLVALIALAGFFLTITVPLLAEKETITISWALMAFMFLWLSNKVASSFLRSLALLLYTIVLFRLATFDLILQFGDGRGSLELASFADYVPLLVTRIWNFGVCTVSLFGAFWLEKRHPQPRASTPESGEKDYHISTLFYWVGVVIFLLYVQLETNAMFFFFAPWRLPMLTVLWCAAGAYFLYRYLRTAAGAFFFAAGIMLGIAVVKIISVDLASWELNARGVYMVPYDPVTAAARFLDFGALLALFFASWHLLRSRESDQQMAPLYGYSGLILLFCYTTLELNALLYWRLRDLQAGGISVLWAMYAMVFVGIGIWKNLRSLRYTGLILFTVVVGKVFLVDLVHTPALYRVLAFLLVGIALLVGAFAYLKAATHRENQH